MSNISSLITLKSELCKRKAEAQSKCNAKLSNTDLYSFKQSKVESVVIPTRHKKQKIDINLKQDTDLDYLKTLENLERKSKLYEELSDQKDSFHDDYLVDFVKKSDHYTKNNEYFKQCKDITINEIQGAMVNKVSDEDEPSYYTNVLNTEIREHGTGYYKFSSNINQRKEQLNELKKFQFEIEKEKINLNKINEAEKEKLQQRLQKIKEKYEVDVSVDDLLPKFQVAEDSEECVSTTIDDFLTNIRSNSRTKNKREWDRGKKPIKFEKLKDVRNNDFAPPMFY